MRDYHDSETQFFCSGCPPGTSNKTHVSGVYWNYGSNSGKQHLVLPWEVFRHLSTRFAEWLDGYFLLSDSELLTEKGYNLSR